MKFWSWSIVCEKAGSVPSRVLNFPNLQSVLLMNGRSTRTLESHVNSRSKQSVVVMVGLQTSPRAARSKSVSRVEHSPSGAGGQLPLPVKSWVLLALRLFKFATLGAKELHAPAGVRLYEPLFTE